MPQQMKDELTCGCRHIDLLHETDILDMALFETPEQGSQMGQFFVSRFPSTA